MKRAAAAAIAAALLAACARRLEPAGARIARAAREAPLEADTRAIVAFGPRVTGSPACARAEEWAAARLVAEGLAPALEPYAAPPGAERAAPPRNVIADVPGGARRGEAVLFGAHLDSTPGSPGASDDAVNAAAVLAVARAFRVTGLRPSRTVRLVLFTGEEQKLAGSRAYVAAHAGERHALAFVVDLGSAPIQGFFMNGRKEPLRQLFRRALAFDPKLVRLFGRYAVWDGTDSFPFVEAGIPALTAYQDFEEYRHVWHTPEDTIERVDFRAARENAALAAALVLGVADDPEPALPLGPRLPPPTP